VPEPKVAVVVGNPKAASRTLGVAEAVAAAAVRAAGFDGAIKPAVVDLALYGPELFDWSSATVRAQLDAVTAADLVVVASPTYKATYTGLLKSFLDWFSTTSLAGVTVVPVMVGAGAHHALAVETYLRPLLIELGATVPTRGLYVLDTELDQLDATLDEWSAHAAPALRALLNAEQRRA
jgi:FMN reductase